MRGSLVNTLEVFAAQYLKRVVLVKCWRVERQWFNLLSRKFPYQMLRNQLPEHCVIKSGIDWPKISIQANIIKPEKPAGPQL